MKIKRPYILAIFFSLIIFNATLTIAIGKSGTIYSYLWHIYVAALTPIIFFNFSVNSKKINSLAYCYIGYCFFGLLIFYPVSELNYTKSLTYTFFGLFIVVTVSTINNYEAVVATIRNTFIAYVAGLLPLIIVTMLFGFYQFTQLDISRLDTETLSSNAIARYLIYGVIMMIPLISTSGKIIKLILFLIIIMSLLLIFLTFSKTIISLLVIVVLGYVLINTSNKNRLKLFILSFLLFIPIYYLTNFTPNIDNLLADTKKAQEEVITLSGRTNLWEDIIEIITLNIIVFLFGHGIGAAEYLLKNIGGFIDAGQAHNAILQSMLETGLIGTLLLNAILISTIHTSFSFIKIQKYSQFFQSIFVLNIVIMIRGFTEGAYAQIGGIDFYLVLFSYAIMHNLKIYKKVYTVNNALSAVNNRVVAICPRR